MVERENMGGLSLMGFLIAGICSMGLRLMGFFEKFTSRNGDFLGGRSSFSWHFMAI